MLNPEDLRKKWTRLVAKTWSDARLRRRLLADPEGVLKEHGIAPPAGVSIKVLENTDTPLHFTLPAKPDVDSDELTDADLEMVAGGACYDTLWLENSQ